PQSLSSPPSTLAFQHEAVSSSPNSAHVPRPAPLSLSLLPPLGNLPLSAGAHCGGSQSANLPSICPPPQCQLTPATPHQDSAGWPSPSLFPAPHHPSSPTLISIHPKPFFSHTPLTSSLFVPALPLVVQLFSETSPDTMPRERSRHSQSQEPGHINQQQS
ncbi:hypothetical protein KUCAC02_001928, partial [Chaenocephalus aceratus]